MSDVRPVRIGQIWEHSSTRVRRRVVRHGPARVNVLLVCAGHTGRCDHKGWISYDDLRAGFILVQEAPGYVL